MLGGQVVLKGVHAGAERLLCVCEFSADPCRRFSLQMTKVRAKEINFGGAQKVNALRKALIICQ